VRFFGLRISEALALKWGDVDWLNSRLKVERAIVCQIVDEVKTPESQKDLHVAPEILDALKMWKQTTQFSANEDWIFASPVQIGKLPWSYDQVWRVYKKAAQEAGLGGFGTQALRHTYRSWLDAVGTPIAVQQKLMRHADIRTTMNVYGDVVTDEMQQGHAKIVGLALG
jgi:integrase